MGIVRARDDSCNNAARGAGWPGARALYVAKDAGHGRCDRNASHSEDQRSAKALSLSRSALSASSRK